MIIVLMGVTGVGKSTIGRRLAEDLGWTFYDADDFHPPKNVEKMRQGIPLTDADRWPWLDAVSAALRDVEAEGRNGVLACSALKKSYRQRLSSGLQDVRFVHLEGPEEVITRRLRARAGHFMDPSLLPSQLEALEAPEDAMEVDVSAPSDAVIEQIRGGLGV
jgi:gluconokinase